VQSSGKSRRDVAKDLGISTNSLREWIKRVTSTLAVAATA